MKKKKILSIICHGGGDHEHIKFIQKNLNAENQVKIDCLVFLEVKKVYNLIFLQVNNILAIKEKSEM